MHRNFIATTNLSNFFDYSQNQRDLLILQKMEKNKVIFILTIFLSFAGICQSCAETPAPEIVPPKPDTLSVFIIGDVMTHTPLLHYDCNTFFQHIKDSVAAADIAIANIEFPLGGPPYSGYPRFSGPDRYADYMASIGTDIFLTANNHILDRDAAGITRTLEYYKAMGDSVRFTGAACSEAERDSNYPLIIDAKGMRLALVNFTYDTNGIFTEGWPNTNYMDTTDVAAAIGRAKAQNADFIIVLPHWGEEYQVIHSPEQELWANWLVDQGADLIIGGHPHSIQDTTHINGVPVIYSLGNAVSNQSQPGTQLELAATVRFVHQEDSSSMMEPQLHFMWCSRPGGLGNSYYTFFVDEWLGRRDEWAGKSDYDLMVSTYDRIRAQSGVEAK